MGERPPKAAAQMHRPEIALARLIERARLQERGGLPKLPRRDAPPWLSRLLTFIDARLGLATGTLPAGWRRRALHGLSILAIRLATGPMRRQRFAGALALARAREQAHEEWLRPPVGYGGSEPESMSIRVAVLLRLLGRPAAALEVMRTRLASGHGGGETAFWVRRLLEEGGEKRAAAALSEVAGAQTGTSATAAGARAPHVPSRLRYGVVMTTLIDSPIFRRSLQSLVESDFTGTVVVVEDGLTPNEACREASEALGARYVKCPEWSGSAAAVNMGIRALADDADVVVFCHNDVLWPSIWFRYLDEGWTAVFDHDKVAVLNLGYLQLKQRTNPMLLELFLRGRYDDLAWLLRAMREIPALLDQVQDAQVKPGEAPFGLARDPWIESVPDLRFQSGRFSVAASFPVRFWKEIGGFDADLPYAFDLQLLQHSVEHRRWVLFTNNPPLVHMKSSDTRAVPHAQQVEIGAKIATTYETFQRTYGWHIEHFLNLYFSETTVIHADEIVEAANAGRFTDVDWVFDDFRERLAVRRLQNCELTWCRTRANCPYTAA